LISLFGSSEIHTVITPDKLFEIGGFPITNSILFGWISAIVIIICFYLGTKAIKLKGNKGVSQLLDVGTEFMVGIVENTLGNRTLAIKYAPIFASMFFFIMLNNWFGLLPGVGPAIVYNESSLFRAFTADANSTFAMAIFGMIVVQVLAIKENGGLGHIKHYFPLSFLNPANYLIGLFEIFTEFTRLISLGLRLFLNVAVGEILISVASYLGGTFAAPIAALPFTLLEIFVGVLQAFIFVVLCIAYLAATTAGHTQEHQEASR